ncbi:MAG: mlnB, partial [Anaerocolumna sp.]|nr:mlnB [Anaerocolumna sp.]
MSGNNYTENEIYQMLFNHEITKEMALDLLSAAPQRTVAGTVPKESQVHIMEEASNRAYQLEDILAEINEIVAGNLHMSEEELEHEMSFKDLGVDSINGIEIIRDVNRHYGLNLDAVVIYDHANITKLSELVLEEMNKNHLTLAQTGVNTPYKEKAGKEYTGDMNSAEAGIDEEEVYLKVSDIISSNLHLPKEELRYEVSFKELGVDSINGIEIIRDVNKSFGLNLDAVTIYDYSTISKLADYVIEEKNRTVKTLKEINPTSNEPGRFLSGNTSNIGDSLNKNENVRVKRGSTETAHKADDFKQDDSKFNHIKGDSTIRESMIQKSLKQESLKQENIKQEKIKQIKQEINKPGTIKLSDIKNSYMMPDYIKNNNKQNYNEENNNNEVINYEKDNIKLENNNTEVIKLDTIQLISTEHIKNAISTDIKSSNMNSTDMNSTDKNFINKNSNGMNTTDINFMDSKEENQNQLHNDKEEDIAVIGISGRFPGAENVEEFWSNLEQEKDSIISIPTERWNSEEYYDSDPKTPGKSYSKVGGFIKGIDKFDPLFFNISPVEAVYMDPQQRLFLEEVWKALEDAGCSDRSLSEKKCGVFVGASQGDYVKALTRNNSENSGEAFTGMAVSILASRISYFLNLIGPCITVDTACSSSLSALHLACQSIRNRESDMAIVGGVRLMVTPDLHIATSKVEMLSKTGKCRAFDNSADGTIISEGVGAIILKPLKIALEEGHSIYGVIKSSGINQDGKTNGITAPSMQSQIRLETDVYERGSIDPREISYIETHGTGTKLGDPIEVKALTSVFEKYTAEKQFCSIGSVKTNIGHTTTAAGVTSIIKVLLAMKHKKIPATLHFKEANTHLSLKETPFYVNHKTIDWRVENNKPRLAAISAFGFSGTNAHVVLQEFNAGNGNELTHEYPYYLITLSAKTRESYDQKVEDLLNWLEKLEDNSNIGDIAYTLQVGRSHFNIRGAFVVKSSSDLKAKLKELAVTGQTADYFKEANNSKPVKADANTKVFISKIFEKLKDSINPDHKEYKDNLIELARLYVQNKVTGCESIYMGRKYKLLHLPTYPFFGDRYWIEDDADLNEEANVEINTVTNREVNTPTYLFEQVKHISKETEKTNAFLHPMIDRKLSATEETAYEKSFQGTEFFLKDHIVQNEKVLPAVAYLEIARAAGSFARNKKVIKIKNNYWLNALKVKEPFQKIKINLHPDEATGNVMEYEVISKVQNEQEILHGKGQIEYAALSQEELNEYLDLNTIKSRCPSLITGLECYQLFIKGGLKLGKSFQSIQKLYYNENEVLASIQLPEHLKGDFHEFLLHPTIMDGALEAVIGMVSAKARNGGVTLPYYIGEVEILGELTENCFSYARYTGRKKNGLQESDSYEVFILDEEGKVLVKVKDFSLWTIGAKANEIQPLVNKVHYYRYIWEKSDIHLPENYLEALESDLLVFDTDNSLSNNLSKRLAGKYNIILVKPGADYVEDGNEFTIAPANKENYVRLIKSFKQKGYVPGNIVYLWSKESDYEFESILMQDPEYTIYPLLYLYQALESLVPEERVKLNYMFQGDGKVFSPFSAAYGGFAKSLRLENTKYISKSIQFNAAFSLEEISNLMILELLAATKEDIEILHTLEGRFVRTIQEYLIEENNIQKETAESNVIGKADFKAKGIYLISGGFGKLGLIVARFLAKDYQAKLCLTSRSPLDEEKITQIKELEALGSEVLVVQGDVSVLNDAAVIIDAVNEKFGRINGVIHCAGMTKDAYLKEKRKDDMEQVIIPKVQGTINLDLLTKDEPLNFIILFSSTAAVTGNIGQADYSYGNCFMDYFSQLRNGLGKQGLRFGNTLSVNWPLWKEGGIQVDKSTENLFDSLGIKSLETTYGIQSLKDALKSGEDQLVVLQGDTQKLRKLLGLKDKAGKVNYKPNNTPNNTLSNIQNNTQSNPQSNLLSNSLINIYKTDLLEDIHQDVKQAVKEILRIKEKDIFLEKDMNEYGFHSLTFTELANKINHLYSIQINPSIFFEYATLGALSDYLYKEHYDSIFAVHGKEETGQITQEAPVNITSLEDDLPNTPAGKREPIAIIGMGGVMPQSEDMISFWRNLEEARDLVTEIPADRWKKEELPDNISKWGGFMKEIDKFDPLFFGISPMEAELMDPQQRIFMQTVWETIEDAGYKPSDLAGSNTGLFVGVSTTDYRDVLKDSEIEALTSTGNSHCILTNRISFLLNLHGPSEPIDTACSSSLVAIHRGVESIYSGDCDMAIVGGVNVIASPTLHISFSKAGMLSPDGRCKTFDEKANGYVRGEGTGAILLKPLSKALKDGDNIYALIKGTAINHGGRAASLTAPNTNAQAEVIMKAFDKAGFEPETVSYIEAHGTGTQLGDPVEVNGLIKAFKEMGKKDNAAAEKEAYCGIGSVKTNIGHLETAAGIASVLKVLLAFKYKTIPGITNFSVQNPYIQLAGSPFYIAEKTKEWKALTDDYGTEIPRRAGVSSFGFGGVNAHIALEAFEEKVNEKDSTDTPHIFNLSARNKERLSAYALKILSFLKKETANSNDTLNNRSLTDFAYTLQVGREEMEERLAIVFSDYKELIHKLADYLQDKEE